LVTCGVYSLTLSFYWSHVEYIPLRLSYPRGRAGVQLTYPHLSILASIHPPNPSMLASNPSIHPRKRYSILTSIHPNPRKHLSTQTSIHPGIHPTNTRVIGRRCVTYMSHPSLTWQAVCYVCHTCHSHVRRWVEQAWKMS
jgi:hypothetical protein